jgi:tetratricopeptide (TPR) repeat protein
MGTTIGLGMARGAAALLLCAGAAGAQDKALNPKDALAPVMRENPKLADPAADLARLRNEGIAHYEGGLTLDRAIVSFQTAWERAKRPADAFNLALVYMRQGKPAEARPWVDKALEGNADFAAAQYLMGLIDKLEGKPEAARARWMKTNELQPLDAQLHYELAMLASAAKDQQTFLQELLRALQIDPEHKSSLYQMYRYYQSAGNKELAAASLKRFNAVKASERFTRKERLFDESGFTRPLHNDPQRATAGFPYLDAALAVEVARPPAGCVLTRLEKIVSIAPAAREDLLGVCADGMLLRIADRAVKPLGKLDGPADELRVEWMDAQGPRVVVAGAAGVRVSTPLEQAPLAFEKIDDKPARRLVVADFDHDGSLDILTDADPVPLTKLDGKYKRPAGPPGIGVPATVFKGSAPVRPVDLTRRGSADLALAAGPEVRLVLSGADTYRDGPALKPAGGNPVEQIEFADLDHDGTLDLIALGAGELVVVWGVGGGNPGAAADKTTRLRAGGPIARFAAADLNNDGRVDLVAIDSSGAVVALTNKAPRSFEAKPLAAAPAPGAATPLLALDENRDGLLDLAYVDGAGGLVLMRNATKNAGKSASVLLNGKRAPATGNLTQVEVRKGPLYSYAQSTGGLVHLGLGREDYAEIVRLEWTNGFVENKIKVDATRTPYVYLESERIAGSCPTIFVRTPQGFRYLTDAMITTAVGILQERGKYFGFGDREYVVVPAGLLTAQDGRLDIRITEELRETTYIDRAQLLAVDHPAGARLASTDRLAPPAGEQPPWHLAQRLVPAAQARYDGRDVTDLLARQDRRYAQTVRRTRNPGFAEPSVIEVDLGADVDPAAVDAIHATGWFLAFDSTAVIGEFKGEAPRLQFPELQQFVDGQWRHVGYVGLPAGQNRTAVLTLAAPLQSRRLRVLAGFSVYWDEIAFSVGGTAPARVVELPLVEAALRFRGFSKIVARDPEVYAYDQLDYTMLWSQMGGRFTNYGPVAALVGVKDGGYAVMGGGDELALSFAAPPAPPAPGYERSYLLVLDGHVKDADRYTAHSETVEPLPALAATAYPAADAVEHPVSARRRQRPGLDFTLDFLSRGKGQE